MHSMYWCWCINVLPCTDRSGLSTSAFVNCRPSTCKFSTEAHQMAFVPLLSTWNRPHLEEMCSSVSLSNHSYSIEQHKVVLKSPQVASYQHNLDSTCIRQYQNVICWNKDTIKSLTMKEARRQFVKCWQVAPGGQREIVGCSQTWKKPKHEH